MRMYKYMYRFEIYSLTFTTFRGVARPAIAAFVGSRSETDSAFFDDMAAPVPQVMDQKVGILGSWK